jgi:hypothetical protein
MENVIRLHFHVQEKTIIKFYKNKGSFVHTFLSIVDHRVT